LFVHANGRPYDLLLGLRGQVLISSGQKMSALFVQCNKQIAALHKFKLWRFIKALIDACSQSIIAWPVDFSLRHQPTRQSHRLEVRLRRRVHWAVKDLAVDDLVARPCNEPLAFTAASSVNVRFWHLADILCIRPYVRFRG
jgi:hypothetical protein